MIVSTTSITLARGLVPIHIQGMPWQFRSYAFDPDRPSIDWKRHWRLLRSRDGKLAYAEAALFLGTAAVQTYLAVDAFKTGNMQSAGIAFLLFGLTFWPFLRHRLRHGDWPQ